MSKIWSDVHKEETLSDNTGMCAQCKDCILRNKIIGFRGKEYGYDQDSCAGYHEKPSEVTRSWNPQPCSKYVKEAAPDTATKETA